MVGFIHCIFYFESGKEYFPWENAEYNLLPYF